MQWVNKGMEVYNTSVKPSVDMAVSVKNASLEKCAMVYDVTVKPSIETYNKALKLASDTTTAVYKVTLEPAVNTATAAKDYSKQKVCLYGYICVIVPSVDFSLMCLRL